MPKPYLTPLNNAAHANDKSPWTCHRQITPNMPSTNNPEHAKNKLPRTMSMPTTNFPEQWTCQKQNYPEQWASQQQNYPDQWTCQQNYPEQWICQQQNYPKHIHFDASGLLAQFFCHCFGLGARLHGRVGNHDRDDEVAEWAEWADSWVRT